MRMEEKGWPGLGSEVEKSAKLNDIQHDDFTNIKEYYKQEIPANFKEKYGKNENC